jgi:integrase
MTAVVDRWHKSRPASSEPLCPEHGKVPTADHGKGKRWQVRYRDAKCIQRKENFARKPAADSRAKVVGGDLVQGVHIDPKAGKVSVQAFAETRWLPSLVHVRPNTADLYQSHLSNHILPVFGGRHVGTLRRTDMKAFVSALERKLSPATVTTVYAVLRSMMQAAVDDGMIPGNPCSRVKLPRIEPRVLKPLTAEQVAALAGAITPRYEVTVWLGAGAGLREGEALGLTVDRVRFLERRLLVEEQMQRGVLSPLKSKASRRVVPLDDVVLNAITRHMQHHPPVTVPGVGRLLVTNRCRRPVRRSSFGHCWQAAVKAAGLPTGTRFHDLRHFFASMLIAAGLNPKTIQVRLGHATISETLDTYGHLLDDHEDHGRGALDAVFSQAAHSDVPSLCPAEGS